MKHSEQYQSSTITALKTLVRSKLRLRKSKLVKN